MTLAERILVLRCSKVDTNYENVFDLIIISYTKILQPVIQTASERHGNEYDRM